MARLRRPVNDVIGLAIRLPRFRPDACVGWNQRAIGKVRPVAADGGVESAPAAGIDGVIDMIDPLDILDRSAPGPRDQMSNGCQAPPARAPDR